MLKIPFAGTFFILITCILSMFYWVFGFAIFNEIEFNSIFVKSTYDKIKMIYMIAGIIGGFIMSHAIVTLMFKVNKWPGANVMFYIALITTSAYFFIYFFGFLKKIFTIRILLRFTILTFFLAFCK